MWPQTASKGRRICGTDRGRIMDQHISESEPNQKSCRASACSVEVCVCSRALRDQVLSIGTGTRKSPHLVPQMRSELGTLYLESRCRDWDRELVLISPTNETGTGPYLVPGIRQESHIALVCQVLSSSNLHISTQWNLQTVWLAAQLIVVKCRITTIVLNYMDCS